MNKFLVGMSCIAFFAATNNVALAQTPDATAASGTQNDGMSDIIVTARRRAELAQDVPLAITAFDQQGLRQNNVTSGSDLARVAPGLTAMASSGNPNIVDFAIRGRGLVYGAAAGSVETYFNEVPLSPNFQMPQLPPQFFDLQSVQVLKGPQGTLFGRSTTGGAVLLQPQLPTGRFEGYGRVQLGNYNNVQVEGAINIPVVDDVLAVRLSGFYWRRDGYVKANAELSSEAQGNLRNPALLAAIFGAGSTYDGQNVVVGSRTVVRNNVIIGGRDGQPFQSIAINNRDVTELRGIVSFTPTPSLTSTTLVTFHQDGNLGGANQGLYLLRNGLGVGTGTFAGPSSNPYDAFLSTDPRKPDSKAWAIINTTTFELSDSLTLKNIFGFIHATGYGVDGNDVDGGPSRTIDTYTSLKADRTNQYTNEFQVQGSTLNDRLQFTVGGLMDLLREPQSYSALNSSSSSGSATGIPDPNRPNANGALIRFLSTNVDSYALFGSFNLKLTDELTLSAGYRHTWDKLKGTQAGTQYDSLLGTGTPLDANPDQPGLQLTRTLNNKFQLNVYNATIDYKIGQDMRVYAGYRHGEKRGAFNSSAFGPFAASFNPEKIDSFSLGFKSQFRTGLGRVTFNVEGFYDKYKDYQASYLLLDAGRPGATFNLLTLTTNIPKVRYAGFDADFRLAMTAGIDLDLSYSYLDAKIISFPDPTVTPTNGLVDPGLTSNRIVAAPKNSLQAAIRFHGDSDWGRWALRPSVSYRSKYYFTTFNRVLPAGQAAIFGQFDNIPFGGGAVPATTLVDARAELNDIGGSQASFALGATNLLNKAYISGVTGTLLFGAEGRAYGPPRMVYGELSYRF